MRRCSRRSASSWTSSPGLTDADLKEIGITALGDRKRILSVIAQGQPQAAPSIPRSERDVPQAAPSSPAAAHVAERRQLTMMFCDLVGSTELAAPARP